MHGGAKFTLTYFGEESDESLIDLYDVAQALVGFQRSLALTAHLVINGELITQSPSLKGARIFTLPPEAGSWKITTIVLATGTALYSIGTTQNNSPIGHLVFSLYDYIVSESLGVHVDYNNSIGKLYEEAKKQDLPVKPVKQYQADSLLEKCHTAILEIHRPINKTQTAFGAQIIANVNGDEEPLQTTLTQETYEFINETRTADSPETFKGRITSYNTNTFKGRIYIPVFGKPVSFQLGPNIQTQRTALLITTSLAHTAAQSDEEIGSEVYVVAFRNTNRTGHLKSLSVIQVSSQVP